MQDFNTAIDESQITYSDDFAYDSNDQVYGNPVHTEDDLAVLRKRKIKSDVGSLIATIGINALPIISNLIKHRNDEIPYKMNTGDLVRLGTLSIIPAIQAIDTVCNKGRIQEAMESKTPFKMSDVRNVVNIVTTYPSAHRYLTNFMGNVVRNTEGKQAIETNSAIKRDTLLGCATTLAPYVIDKFSDDSMTFAQKLGSVVPVKIFGGWVRRLADANPTTRRLYDGFTAVVNVASVGNRELGNLATKANKGQNKSAQNAFGAVLDVVQDMTGMSRGRVGGYYDNDRYGGSRWSF